MTQKQEDALCSCFLFKGMPDKEVHDAISTFRITDYKKGDTIFQKNRFEQSVGIVLHGSVMVYQKGVLLNTIGASGAFGVSALFHPAEQFVTEIIAKNAVTIAFLPFEELLKLFAKFPAISLNYISFLSERITFLNERIASLAASSVEEKVLEYLRRMEEDGAVNISGGYTKLASALNIGRASLYRVLDSLEDEGLIRRNGKKITLLSQPQDS